MKKIQIKVCCGIHCSTQGGQELLDLLENDPKIREHSDIKYEECVNHFCEDGKKSPVIEIDGKIFPKMTAERLVDMMHSLINKMK